jgi:hypothetical protein
LAIGIPCAVVSGRVVRSMLHGIAANDPLTIAGHVWRIVGRGMVAGIVPACRAASIDPMAALRRNKAQHRGV